jgi:amidase
VEEAAPPQFASGEFQALTGAYLPLKVLWRASEAEAALGRALTANDLERSTYALYRIGQTRTLADFSTTLNSIDALTQGALRWWASGYDILLTPTTGRPPIPLGLMAADYASVEKVFRLWGNSTAFANLTGLPACSVPLHWTADGMPIGVQLFADIWRDDLLIRLASQLEEASPWRDRIPPLHA